MRDILEMWICLLIATVKCYNDVDPRAGLVEHNRLRKLHCVPELVWDDELQKTAQAHADEQARRGSMFHGWKGYSRGLIGENLGQGWIKAGHLNYTAAAQVIMFK